MTCCCCGRVETNVETNLLMGSTTMDKSRILHGTVGNLIWVWRAGRTVMGGNDAIQTSTEGPTRSELLSAVLVSPFDSLKIESHIREALTITTCLQASDRPAGSES